MSVPTAATRLSSVTHVLLGLSIISVTSMVGCGDNPSVSDSPQHAGEQLSAQTGTDSATEGGLPNNAGLERDATGRDGEPGRNTPTQDTEPSDDIGNAREVETNQPEQTDNQTDENENAQSAPVATEAAEAAQDDLDRKVNSGAATNGVRTLKAMGLAQEGSHTARGIDRLLKDAEKGEASFEHVTLAVRLIREGKADGWFQVAMLKYAEADTDEKKQEAVRMLLTAEPRVEIQTLVALGVLDKEGQAYKDLQPLIVDAAKGIIGVDVPAAAVGAFRAGRAGSEFNQALNDYAKTTTEEGKLEAASKIMETLKQ